MKKKFYFVSIIVPIKNKEKIIKKCIDSLLSLNYPKYEIIFIDNGSKDNSLAILKEYKDKKIKVLFEQKPGAYNARNQGIQRAKGEIIAFTDGDCVANKNWLKFLVRPFKDKKIGGVGGKIDVYKPKNEFEMYCSKFYHLNEMYIKDSYLITANVAYKKEIFKQVGLFDGNLPSGGDVDMSWRIVNFGYGLYFEPKAVVSHWYEETFLKMVSKFFWHGKYQALLNIKHGVLNKKKRKKEYIISLKQMFGKYSLKWIFYRIIQDLSFHTGISYGNVFWKFKNRFN